MVNPNWSKLGRRFTLNELLLLAQQRQKNSALESLHEDLILARTPSNLLAPADVFAATIVTLQSNHFLRRVSVLFDGAVVLFIALLASRAVQASRIDLVARSDRFHRGLLPDRLHSNGALRNLGSRACSLGNSLVTRSPRLRLAAAKTSSRSNGNRSPTPGALAHGSCTGIDRRANHAPARPGHSRSALRFANVLARQPRPQKCPGERFSPGI